MDTMTRANRHPVRPVAQVRSPRHLVTGACLMLVLGGLFACGGGAGGASVVAVDGSSTVFPIAEAVAEEYQRVDPAARVTVGVSGTGGGFKKFCAGETDISNASRPIRPVEIEACAAAGIEFIELPIAYDGIAVVVHASNEWVHTLTPDILKRIWEPEAQGTITRWSEVQRASAKS